MPNELTTTASTALATPQADPNAVLDRFLRSKRNENTRAAYRRDLEAYFAAVAAYRFEDGSGIENPLFVAQPIVDDYARALEDLAGYSPATAARKLSAVSAFYTYANRNGILTANPARHVERPPVSNESPTLGLDLAEFAALLETAEASSLRERVLVGLLGEVGLRVTAVCEARIEDLDTAQGHRVLTTQGKGGKVTTRRLPADLAAAIDELTGERVEGPILLRPRSGKAYDRFEVARLIRELAKRAGIPKRITPHSLRHTHATLSLLGGAKLEDVSEALGHSDPRTTMRYHRALGRLDRDPTHLLEASLEQARAQVRETRKAL